SSRVCAEHTGATLCASRCERWAAAGSRAFSAPACTNERGSLTGGMRLSSLRTMLDRIGSCRVVGEIGSAGMAVIYKAIQEPLDREVAIKALKPSIALDSQFAARFEREARFMASLQHENILHVY